MLDGLRQGVERWLVPRLHRVPLLRAIGRRILRRRIIRQPFHGGVICLDAVDHSLLWTGDIAVERWDDDIQDRLLTLSRDCQSIIDLGANIGAMSISVALRNPGIAVVCVEPNARACALLRRTIALNGLGGRVTLFEAVAGDSDGTLAFDEGGSTTGHITPGGAMRKRSLDAARLIEASASQGRCLVKMDVEGYETVILAGLSRIASRRNVVLAAELHALGFNGAGNPAACGAMLLESGAVLSDPDGRPLAAIDSWTDELQTRQIEARWTA